MQVASKCQFDLWPQPISHTKKFEKQFQTDQPSNMLLLLLPKHLLLQQQHVASSRLLLARLFDCWPLLLRFFGHLMMNQTLATTRYLLRLPRRQHDVCRLLIDRKASIYIYINRSQQTNRHRKYANFGFRFSHFR